MTRTSGVNQHQTLLLQCTPHRHLQSARPTRAQCGASIAWVNITTKADLATCVVCIATARETAAQRPEKESGGDLR